MKLFDSELRVMETLWKLGDLTAGQIAKILNQQIGWNRNTTYTVIKKLIEKEAIERALRRADGNITRAAELLGITRFALYRKLDKLGL